jgi:hypothetical protein
VVVSKNGTSAAYSDGVSSTINMSTNDEVGTAFKGGIGINLINADAFLEIPLAKKSRTRYFWSSLHNRFYKHRIVIILIAVFKILKLKQIIKEVLLILIFTL